MFNERDTVAIARWGQNLGWLDIKLRKHPYKGDFIYWFEAGSLDSVFFEINFLPVVQAAVYAIPYRICTGWHEIPREIFETVFDRNSSEQKKFSFLERKCYSSKEERRLLILKYPEFYGFQWAKEGGLERSI